MKYAQLSSLLFFACGPSQKKDDCDPSNVIAGELTGIALGNDWTATGVIWNQSGNSVQINTDMSNGWRLSIVLQQSDSGEIPVNLVGKEGPWAFDLGENGGGWATAYPQTGNSSSSRNQGEGTFIMRTIDNELSGCLEFATADFSIEDGKLIALPLGE